MDNELVAGIDLGTTNSCIAVKHNGKIEVIPNYEGDRTTLSFVYYRKNQVLVGKTAKYEAASKPSNGIYEIKRLIGCLYDDIDFQSKRKTYNYIRRTNGEIKIELENENGKFHVIPEEVCARILHKLKVDAEKYLGQEISRAIITVPAYFNNFQRAATRDAAKIAGIEVIKLTNEPSAAAIAYIHDNEIDKGGIVLIFDLGGGTFDVSLVQTYRGHVRVLSVAGDTHLGGQDFLNRLVDYVLSKVWRKYKVDVKENKRYVWKIVNLCEEAKKILTSAKSTTIVLDFLPGDEECLEVEITREKFEEINEDLFNRTVEIVDSCIEKIKIDKNAIDEVLLVGGASRMPKIEQLLKTHFNNKDIQRNINADEAIATGAAIEAEFLKKYADTRSLLVDILPLSIGTVLDDENIVINFTRNTSLPATCKIKQVIKRTKERKKACILSVFEGDHVDCSKNVLLGAHEIKWLKDVRRDRNIEINMHVNNDGIVWITVKGDTVKTFSVALNKGRLEEKEIVSIREKILHNLL